MTTYLGKTKSRRDYERAATARLMRECGRRGYLYRDVARATGIQENTVYGYSAGNHAPGLGAFAKICAACGVSADKVLGLKEVR